MVLKEFEELSTICPIKSKSTLNFLIRHLSLLDKYMNEEVSPYGLGNNKTYSGAIRVKSQLGITYNLCFELLKPYQQTLALEYRDLTSGYGKPFKDDINRFFDHAIDLFKIEFSGEEEIEEGNLFLGIEEKMKRANESAKSNNKEGLFSNLHTVFEILLKDELGIALDMDGAKLGKVIRICLEKKVFNGKESILKQISKDICDVDNKIKHSGYDPKPKEINDALLIGQQGIRVLKNEIPNLDESVKEEISKILIKNN